MSFLWFKKFGRKSDAKGATFLMRSTNGLVYRAPACPCHEWHIVTFCPTTACDMGMNEKPYLGEPAFFPDIIPGTEDEAHPRAGQPVFDSAGKRVYMISGDSAGFVGHHIGAIYHKIESAKFDCTVSAKIYIDSVQVKSVAVGGGTVLEGAAPFIGTDSFLDLLGVSYGTNYLAMDYLFSSAGMHTLDIVVTYTPTEELADVEEAWSYTHRGIIYIYPKPEDLEAYKVYVVPAELYHGLTIAGTVEIGGTDYPTNLMINVLKGPFYLRSEAEYVLSVWGDFIRAYAQTCICLMSGCNGRDIRATVADWNSTIGAWVLDYPAAGAQSSVSCDTGWLYYNIYQFSEDVVVRKTFKGADIGAAPAEGTLGPCEGIYLTVTDTSAFVKHGWTYDAISNTWGADPYGEVFPSGESEPLHQPGKCCVDDDESPYYALAWDYVPGDEEHTPDGVPGNSDELNNYKRTQ